MSTITIRKSPLFRFIALTVLVTFVGMLPAQPGWSQGAIVMPPAGQMVPVSRHFEPPQMVGLKINLKDPFSFDFIMDQGESPMSDVDRQKEFNKIIKYFLVSLAVPNKDMWVNLSPYESHRIIPEVFAQTEMGRDLLAQDYILKQFTASLMYPEDGLGRTFWNKVYKEAQARFGTTNIKVDTFNKVWIVADKADIYQKGDTAFLVDSHLKVMLEQDYMAPALQSQSKDAKTQMASDIVRAIIIPAIEKEVNEGQNFAAVRQAYNAEIMATWFKKTLRESLLGQVFADKSKIAGQRVDDPQAKEKIYKQYLRAYKKGVFNYIKEDPTLDGQTIPRKYFSGGMQQVSDEAMRTFGPEIFTLFGKNGASQYADEVKEARSFGNRLQGLAGVAKVFLVGVTLAAAVAVTPTTASAMPTRMNGQPIRRIATFSMPASPQKDLTFKEAKAQHEIRIAKGGKIIAIKGDTIIYGKNSYISEGSKGTWRDQTTSQRVTINKRKFLGGIKATPVYTPSPIIAATAQAEGRKVANTKVIKIEARRVVKRIAGLFHKEKGEEKATPPAATQNQDQEKAKVMTDAQAVIEQNAQDLLAAAQGAWKELENARMKEAQVLRDQLEAAAQQATQAAADAEQAAVDAERIAAQAQQAVTDTQQAVKKYQRAVRVRGAAQTTAAQTQQELENAQAQAKANQSTNRAKQKADIKAKKAAAQRAKQAQEKAARDEQVMELKVGLYILLALGLTGVLSVFIIRALQESLINLNKAPNDPKARAAAKDAIAEAERVVNIAANKTPAEALQALDENIKGEEDLLAGLEERQQQENGGYEDPIRRTEGRIAALKKGRDRIRKEIEQLNVAAAAVAGKRLAAALAEVRKAVEFEDWVRAYDALTVPKNIAFAIAQDSTPDAQKAAKKVTSAKSLPDIEAALEELAAALIGEAPAPEAAHPPAAVSAGTSAGYQEMIADKIANIMANKTPAEALQALDENIKGEEDLLAGLKERNEQEGGYGVLIQRTEDRIAALKKGRDLRSQPHVSTAALAGQRLSAPPAAPVQAAQKPSLKAAGRAQDVQAQIDAFAIIIKREEAGILYIQSFIDEIAHKISNENNPVERQKLEDSKKQAEYDLEGLKREKTADQKQLAEFKKQQAAETAPVIIEEEPADDLVVEKIPAAAINPDDVLKIVDQEITALSRAQNQLSREGQRAVWDQIQEARSALVLIWLELKSEGKLDLTILNDKRKNPYVQKAITRLGNNPGGINLSNEHLTINIKVDGAGMPLPAQYQDKVMTNLDGLTAIILRITPITPENVPALYELVK